MPVCLSSSRLSLAALWTCFWLGGIAHAEQRVVAGDYEVHYNALSTSFLTPAIATQYNIPRSNRRAMLNITVLHKSDQFPLGQAVTAQITASATNLTGLRRELPLTLIEEGTARYYVGHVRVAHEETLSFEIAVAIDGQPRPIEISFRKKFYAD